MLIQPDFQDFQTFADTLPIALWVADGKENGYRIRLWNNSAAEIYGYSAQEAIGTSFLELFVEPFLRDHAAHDCDGVISGQFTHPSNVVTVDGHRDGAPIILLTNVFRLFHQGQAYQAEVSINLTSPPLFEIIAPNYRELIREADSSPEVRQLDFLLAQRLDTERAQVSAWAAGVMHDIRAEAGSARDHFISYRRRANAARSDRDIIHLDNLLRSLAFRADGFIGVYGGNPRSLSGEFDGLEVLESELNRLSEYGPTMFRASIESSIDSLTGPVMLRGRREAFRQCVYNLMQNACRHMRPGRHHRYVSVNAQIRHKPGVFELHILNPGTMNQVDAIGPASLDRVSLGLPLVRSLADEVDGRLTLKVSTVNKRSVVEATLTWPLAISDHDESLGNLP